MAQGGIGLLARTADDAEDPQTLRMVAGAIANLCGNGMSIAGRGCHKGKFWSLDLSMSNCGCFSH